MKRSWTLGLLAVAIFALPIGACAKSKPSEATPTASATASVSIDGGNLSPNGSAPPAPRKLCSDNLHRPGDHWKEACNPCRCAMDGEITCAHFPCPEAGPTEAGAPDAGPRREAGTAP